MKYITTEFKKFVKENLHAKVKETKVIENNDAKSVMPLLYDLMKERERTWNLDHQEQFENLFK